MKKIGWLFPILLLFVATGCFDSAEETTINDNGSGLFTSTIDMSKLITLAKTFGGDNKEMKELESAKKDTTVSLATFKDSIGNFNDAEKKLLDKGSLRLIMDMGGEKMNLTFSFPFSKTAEIASITQLLKKSKGQIVSKIFDKIGPGDAGGDDNKEGAFGMPGQGEEQSDISDYYDYVFEKGHLSCKLNKEKYANVGEDKSLKTMQEMAQMGLSASFKKVINLPKPAKKAEGKGIKLSNDKKQITIEGTLDDFFEEASYFEYDIEY